jgi:hypothetical protein
MNEIDEMFELIRMKLESLRNECDKRDFMDHLRSLARWHADPIDYREPSKVIFPDRIFISYAVCHPECGVSEFIVDGSTQECQHCGSLMFRTAVAEYNLTVSAQD